MLKLQRIDARSQENGQSQASSLIASLRESLSINGDIASPKSRQLTERVFGAPLTPREVVERICRDVRHERDSALCRYSADLDQFNASPASLRVPTAMIVEARRAASPAFVEAIVRIRASIEAFQQALLATNVSIEPRPGLRLTQRYTPLRRVGLCIPGGAAAYPSSVLMTAVPALVAGVPQIAVMAPPTPFGAFNPDVLTVCHELGIEEVYAMGGAQGVAALAYGTESISPVDKIVGPGNLYVALAKKAVYGEVDIDSIAGPSEVLIIADASANPRFIAADMLAQAEHSPGSSLLISWDEALCQRVEQELEQQLHLLERADLILPSLEAFGAIILVQDREQAVSLANEFAPEHLEILSQDSQWLVDRIVHAGATFVGPFSPVAVGDYASGPSHVLPTCGTARWAAGLNANAFLRGNSIIEMSQDALLSVADDVRELANREGLTAHRRSVDLRFE